MMKTIMEAIALTILVLFVGFCAFCSFAMANAIVEEAKDLTDEESDDEQSKETETQEGAGK